MFSDKCSYTNNEMFKEYACRNYPTIQHQSYGRCDKDFVEEECKIIGLALKKEMSTSGYFATATSTFCTRLDI